MKREREREGGGGEGMVGGRDHSRIIIIVECIEPVVYEICSGRSELQRRGTIAWESKGRASLARPSPSSLPVTNNRCSPSPCILRCMEVYRPIVGFFGFRVEFMVNFFAPLYRVDFVGRSVVYFVLKENDSMIWMTRVRCCGVELCTVVSIRINIVQVWDDNISGILNFEKFFRFFCNMNFNINGSFY